MLFHCRKHVMSSSGDRVGGLPRVSLATLSPSWHHEVVARWVYFHCFCDRLQSDGFTALGHNRVRLLSNKDDLMDEMG